MQWVSEKILEYINYENGIYIECGANDGITQSNTYYLEKNKNWFGFLIEPSNKSFNECVKNRSEKNVFVNCALVSKDYKSKLIEGDFDGNLMSSVGGKRRGTNSTNMVVAKTLTEILDEYSFKEIDFFSLDVEGYEFDVLKGIDYDQYSFKYILIEIYEWDFEKIKQLLESKNYSLVKNLSGFNLENNPNWDGTHNDYLFVKNENN